MRPTSFTFKGIRIRRSDKAFREFKRRVKELTGRSGFVSMAYRHKKRSRYVRGWMNYFGISEYYRPIPEIDHRPGRGMRMCYWGTPEQKFGNSVEWGFP